jgi:hypothetical protein
MFFEKITFILPERTAQKRCLVSVHFFSSTGPAAKTAQKQKPVPPKAL